MYRPPGLDPASEFGVRLPDPAFRRHAEPGAVGGGGDLDLDLDLKGLSASCLDELQGSSDGEGFDAGEVGP